MWNDHICLKLLKCQVIIIIIIFVIDIELRHQSLHQQQRKATGQTLAIVSLKPILLSLNFFLQLINYLSLPNSSPVAPSPGAISNSQRLKQWSLPWVQQQPGHSPDIT